jgi:hypothetical protein
VIKKVLFVSPVFTACMLEKRQDYIAAIQRADHGTVGKVVCGPLVAICVDGFLTSAYYFQFKKLCSTLTHL